MRRRFVREESGVALGLAIIIIVLVGVMGAGLLVFVRNDLEAVVEVNQGQRAFNLADAGVQAARRELLSQPAADLYDGESTDNSGWAYAGQSGAPTKTLDMEEGTVAITIQYLSPSASERQAGQVDFAPEPLPSGQDEYPDGRDYFRVVSEGQAGEARRIVEAIYYTTDLSAPKGFYTPEDIRLEDTADVNDVSLFAGGDVTLTGNAGISGEDRAYGDWYNPPFNERRRATMSAGIGAGGQIDGVSASNLGTRDFDANTSPRFVKDSSEDSRGNGIYFPFDYRSQPDIEYLRDEAIKQEAETGQDNYRQVSGGRQRLRSWPDGSTDRTVVFVENTGDGNNEVVWEVPGACTDDPPKRGTLVVSNSSFEMLRNRALFAGTVIVRGGDNEDANSVDVGGGACIDGYVNATGTITIAGEVRRSGSASEENRPGFFDVRLWSWRELYE